MEFVAMHKMVPYAVYRANAETESALNSDQTAVFDVCATGWNEYLAAGSGYSRLAGKGNRSVLLFPPQRRRKGEHAIEDRS